MLFDLFLHLEFNRKEVKIFCCNRINRYLAYIFRNRSLSLLLTRVHPIPNKSRYVFMTSSLQSTFYKVETKCACVCTHTHMIVTICMFTQKCI